MIDSQNLAYAIEWVAFLVFIYKAFKLVINRNRPIENVVKNVVQESCHHTYYLAWKSSYFDSHPYDKKFIADTVKATGKGINIRYEHYNGWCNQPEVVCFEVADILDVSIIEQAVSNALQTPWILVPEKDWK